MIQFPYHNGYIILHDDGLYKMIDVRQCIAKPAAFISLYENNNHVYVNTPGYWCRKDLYIWYVTLNELQQKCYLQLKFEGYDI